MDRLLNSREQLLVLLNALADAVTAEDRDGKLIFANEAAAHALGYPSADALLGTSIGDVLGKFEITDEAGDVVEMERFPVQLALQGIRTPDTTFRFRERDTGRDHWLILKSRPAFNDTGEVHFVVSILQDVTQIKEAEKALQESQRRLQAIFDNTHNPLMLANDNARFIDVNPAAEMLTGYSRDELLNLHIWDITPELGTAAGKRLWNVFSEKQQQEGEYTVRRKDGSDVQVEYRAVANVAPGMHLSVLQDMTVYRENERQREELLAQEREARLKAEEADEIKLSFLAMISHELRTPLTSIKGFSSTLLAEDVNWDADSQRDFLSIIDQEANKLTNLVEQLLEVSRLQSRTLSIHPLSQLFTSAVQSAMPQLLHITSRHEFAVDIASDLPVMSFDAQRISQVIVNLVDNATKYSPTGTKITLAARRHIDYLQISVSDEGIGIPPEAHQTAFEAFRRLENANSSQKGAGLGLAICKGLVEAHGGHIWVENQPPPGTTISFTLPIGHDFGWANPN